MVAANADLTRDIPYILDQWILKSSVPTKAVTTSVISVTTPSQAATLAGEVATATATLTGASIGDIITATPAAALPTNQAYVSAYVSAANTITFVFANIANGVVTGAATNFNVQRVRLV